MLFFLKDLQFPVTKKKMEKAKLQMLIDIYF